MDRGWRRTDPLRRPAARRAERPADAHRPAPDIACPRLLLLLGDTAARCRFRDKVAVLRDTEADRRGRTPAGPGAALGRAGQPDMGAPGGWNAAGHGLAHGPGRTDPLPRDGGPGLVGSALHR